MIVKKKQFNEFRALQQNMKQIYVPNFSDIAVEMDFSAICIIVVITGDLDRVFYPSLLPSISWSCFSKQRKFFSHKLRTVENANCIVVSVCRCASVERVMWNIVKCKTTDSGWEQKVLEESLQKRVFKKFILVGNCENHWHVFFLISLAQADAWNIWFLSFIFMFQCCCFYFKSVAL